MSSFTLKPGLTTVFLPGAGRVQVGATLVGEQFRRFVPLFLVEIPETKAAPVAVAAVKPTPAPKVPTPKEPEPVLAPVEPPASVDAPKSPPAEAPAIIAPAPSAPVRPVEKEKKKKKG
jgi:hypothetical protein